MILKQFSDIGVPIKEIWSNNDFKNLSLQSKMNVLIENKKLIYEFDEEIDNIFMYAIRYYDNLNNFIVFGLSKKDTYKYYEDCLKDDYIIYGIKQIELDTQLIPKIMYQLLFTRIEIKYKNDLYHELEESYPFLYDTYKKESGKKGSKKKIDVSILIVCKRSLKKKTVPNDISEKDHVVYFPNTKEEKWICSSLFLCNSSLKFIEKQNFEFFLTKENENSKKMFLGYREWLMQNIDLKSQFQFLLFSSIVLYLIGHRAMNDVDLYVHKVSEEVKEKLEELKTEEFNYVEFKVKDTDNWPRYWDTWLDEWAQKCGAKYFEEVLGNPKYHFYFLGVKIISLECDIVRRVHRNRPRAIADLISFRKRYSYNIDIPSIPLKYNKFIGIDGKTTEEINELLRDNPNSVLNTLNKEIIIECETDISRFINTIIYALDTRYRMTFTSEEIRRELRMDYMIKQPNLISEKKKFIKIKIKK